MMLVFAFAQKAPKSFHMLNPEKPLPGLLAERPGPSPAETSGPALATRPTPWFAQTRHRHSSWQQDLPSATRDDCREVLHCSRTTSRRWGCHHHTPQHQHHSPRGSLGTLVQGRGQSASTAMATWHTANPQSTTTRPVFQRNTCLHASWLLYLCHLSTENPRRQHPHPRSSPRLRGLISHHPTCDGRDTGVSTGRSRLRAHSWHNEGLSVIFTARASSMKGNTPKGTDSQNASNQKEEHFRAQMDALSSSSITSLPYQCRV